MQTIPNGAQQHASDFVSTPAYRRLFDLATETFGNGHRAENWLMTVQAPWGVLPAYHARTPQGANEVERLLWAIIALRDALRMEDATPLLEYLGTRASSETEPVEYGA